MHWIIWSFLAMMFWGLWAFYSRIAAVKESLVAYFLTGIVCHLLMILYLWRESPIQLDSSLIPPFIAQACTTLASLFYLYAMKDSPSGATVLGLISLYSLIGSLLYWIFMREMPSLLQILGILFAISAIILLSVGT